MMTVFKTTKKHVSCRLENRHHLHKEVTHGREEDLETTEGEGVDILAELLELVEWPQVNDEETERSY